jgi:hypothetical protein
LRRLKLTPRPDWQAKAEAVGFVYHHTEGQAYWDESVAYAFTLDQVEQDLEPAAAELHDLCLDLVDEVAGSQELMERLAIPAEHRDFVAASWRAKSPSLYGRFDFGYDGKAKPKLYEYNADTPTSVFEAATFQWLWLEELIANGTFPANADQFNSLFEALRDRFKVLFPTGGFVHFASDEDAVEDRQTVRFLEDLALQAGRRAQVRGHGQYRPERGGPVRRPGGLRPAGGVQALSLGVHAARALRRAPEHRPGALDRAAVEGDPVQQGHPAAAVGAPSRPPQPAGGLFRGRPGGSALGGRFVRKPLFSREGANVEVVGGPTNPCSTRAMARRARSSRPTTRRRNSTASARWSAPGWSATSPPASASARTTAW